MLEKRIPKNDALDMQTWCLPVLGASGSILPSHEKQLKEGKNESIQHLSAYVQNGRLTSDVLEKLHQQIYDEGLAKGQTEGYKTGYEQGFQTGQKGGYQDGRYKAEQEAKKLHELFDQLLEPLKDKTESVEQWMLQTVKAICLGIMQRECKADEAVLLSFVKESVAILPASIKTISITLHPDDLTLINRYCQHKSLNWNLLPDSELLRGDCCVSNGASSIDYTLSARVEQALDAIMTAVSNADQINNKPEVKNIDINNTDASFHH